MASRDFFDEFVLPLLRIFNGEAGPPSDRLWWRTDGENAPVTFMLRCPDLFGLMTGNCETLTPADLPLLAQCVTDLQTLSPDGTYREADSLFCCRKRQMRPQRRYAQAMLDAWELPLFDACGPAWER